MRRLPTHAVDELNSFLRKLLEIREGDGNLLPGYAEAILVFLRLQPEGTARMAQLQKRLGISSWRTGRLCRALERKGLARIVPHTDDRREKSVRLTSTGERLVDKTVAA